MKPYLLFALIILLSACKDRSNPEASTNENGESPLFEDVMAIHDEVMPEMATLHRLKKQLQEIETPENKDFIANHIKSINESDEAMMTWMATFEMPSDKNEVEEYLRGEKVKVSEVRNMMNAAISSATSALDSLNRK